MAQLHAVLLEKLSELERDNEKASLELCYWAASAALSGVAVAEGAGEPVGSKSGAFRQMEMSKIVSPK